MNTENARAHGIDEQEHPAYALGRMLEALQDAERTACSTLEFARQMYDGAQHASLRNRVGLVAADIGKAGKKAKEFHEILFAWQRRVTRLELELSIMYSKTNSSSAIQSGTPCETTERRGGLR